MAEMVKGVARPGSFTMGIAGVGGVRVTLSPTDDRLTFIESGERSVLEEFLKRGNLLPKGELQVTPNTYGVMVDRNELTEALPRICNQGLAGR